MKNFYLFILILLIFTPILIIWPISTSATLVGNVDQATLKISPDSGTFNVGNNLSLSLYVNTYSQNVVSVTIYLSYDKAHFNPMYIDTTNSIFNLSAQQSIDSANGVIKIARGNITSNAVNTSEGLVAKINFQATSATNPSSDNFILQFAPGDDTKSGVYLNQSMNVLAGVYNGRYTVTSNDTTPPAITSVWASSITSSAATITWTTDEAADSQIEYGSTTAYGLLTTLNSSMTTSHSQILNNLTPFALYHYRANSRDAAGNLAKSLDDIFTTNAASNYSSPSPSPSPTPCSSYANSNLPYANGSILKSSDSDKIYLIVNNQKRWITSPSVFTSYGLVGANQKTASQTELNQYQTGADINQPSLSEGTLIRATGDFKVYIIQPPYKRHIFNPAIFNMYQHFSWNSIKDLDPSIVDSYITSDIYRADGDAKVYSLQEVSEAQGKAIKHHVNLAPAQFTAQGYSWDQIFIVNAKERDYYETGSEIVDDSGKG